MISLFIITMISESGRAWTKPALNPLADPKFSECFIRRTDGNSS